MNVLDDYEEPIETESSDWEPVEFVANVECPHCKKSTNIYCGNAYFGFKEFECEKCRNKFQVRWDL